MLSFFFGCLGATTQEDSPGWDPRYTYREPSTALKLYLLFLGIVCFVCFAKLIQIWRIAPPFALSRRIVDGNYSRRLKRLSKSLQQWIGLTFLGWGLWMSTSIYDVSGRLLEQKRIGGADIAFVSWDYSVILTMALSVVLFLFVSRWHMLNRIDWLESRKNQE
jgi:hypothetical protein